MNKIEKKARETSKDVERVKARLIHVKHVCISKEVNRFKVRM
jgi:hypothetical protein